MALWKKIGWALKEKKNEAFLSIVCTGDRNFCTELTFTSIQIYIFIEMTGIFISIVCVPSLDLNVVLSFYIAIATPEIFY